MITQHACIRWLERVEGVDLTEIREAAAKAGFDPTCDGHVLQQLWQSWGLSIHDIHARILTPFVLSALKAGATRIKVGSAVIKADGGKIHTVLTKTMENENFLELERQNRTHHNNWKPRKGPARMKKFAER
jgi:hypothetical protein